MLRKLTPTEFQTALVIGTFALTLAVFLFFFTRALMMKKKEADRLSRLPLQDSPEKDKKHD